MCDDDYKYRWSVSLRAVILTGNILYSADDHWDQVYRETMMMWYHLEQRLDGVLMEKCWSRCSLPSPCPSLSSSRPEPRRQSHSVAHKLKPPRLETDCNEDDKRSAVHWTRRRVKIWCDSNDLARKTPNRRWNETLIFSAKLCFGKIFRFPEMLRLSAKFGFEQIA